MFLKFYKAFISLIVVIHLFNNAFGVDFDFEGDLSLSNAPFFVSLGSHCEVALTLRNSGLRNAAFPFDWLVTRNSQLLAQVLDDDFKFFTDKESFIHLYNERHSVKNQRYDILFHHEWPFSEEANNPSRDIEQLNAIEIKYQRRIDRFRKLRQYPGKVFFIRNPFWEEFGNAEQVKELKEALDRYFPLLDFTLVIVNYADQNSPEIPKFDKVIQFTINRSSHIQEYQHVYHMLIELTY